MTETTHPQPACDLLLSVDSETGPQAETVCYEWRSQIDADTDSDIRDHPEIWNHCELPDRLSQIELDTTIGLAYSSRSLNLNAVSKRLGLDTVEYDPEVYSGLVYHPETPDIPVVLYSPGIILGIADGHSEESVAGAIEQTKDTIESRGIDLGDTDIRVGTVADQLAEHSRLTAIKTDDDR